MWLVIALDKDGHEVARLELATGELTIGRDQDRQIQLASASVSRRHARLMVSNGQLLISDEGSANGIIVNGTRITAPTPIDSRSRVEIAEFRITIESMNPEPTMDPPTPSVPPMAVGAGTGTAAVVESIRLVAQGGPFDGRVVPVIGDVSVGRAAENQLVLDDPSLSRKHAKARGVGRKLEVEDLGSSNGTFVNGRKVGKALAVPGDTVRFGELTFRVEDERGQGAPAGTGGGSVVPLILGGLATFGIVIAAVVVLAKHRPTTVSAKEAIAKLTHQAEDHLAKGKQRFADKKWSDAKIELDQAIELDPANVEARRLKALASRAPEDDRNVQTATSALAIGDRRGLETALHLRDELLPATPARAALEAKLAARLMQFGEQRFDEHAWADSAWALCRAYEVNAPLARADARAARNLQDAYKKLSRTTPPCRAAR